MKTATYHWILIPRLQNTGQHSPTLNEIRMITNPVSECERLPRWCPQCHTNMTAPIWIIMREPKRCTEIVKENYIIFKQSFKTIKEPEGVFFLNSHIDTEFSSLPQTVSPSTKTAEFLELYHYTCDSQRCPQPPSAEQKWGTWSLPESSFVPF